jgi:large subunit ribosomal protein L15
MNLGDLRPAAGARKKAKKIGRGPGSGHGKTSTRGHKGHKARSGGGKRGGFEGGQMPLYRRLPKRGFHNPERREFEVVNLRDLARVFPAGGDLTLEALAKAGLVTGSQGRPLKVLAEGALPAGQAFVVHAHAFSKAAADKIQATGGRAEVVPA